MIPFPDKKYKVIYADPPWSYSSYTGDEGKAKKNRIWGRADYRYKTMSIEAIKALPVQTIAEKDCILFLWSTFPNLQQGLDVLKAWGFEYKTVAFVWIKQDRTNNLPKKYGLGWYTRTNAEIVMLGRKGRFDRQSADVKQVVMDTIAQHSEKPNEVRKRIVQLCGDISRIELFARQKIPGWDAWGNEVEDLPTLEQYSLT